MLHPILSEKKAYIPKDYLEYRLGSEMPKSDDPIDIAGNTPWHFWCQNYWNTLSLETDKDGNPRDKRWLLPNAYGVTPLQMRMANGVPFFNAEERQPDWLTKLWCARLPNGMTAAELYACYAMKRPPLSWYNWHIKLSPKVFGYLLVSGNFPEQLDVRKECKEKEVPPAVLRYHRVPRVELLFEKSHYVGLRSPLTITDMETLAPKIRPPLLRRPLVPLLRIMKALDYTDVLPESKEDLQKILESKDQYLWMGAEGMNLVEAMAYTGVWRSFNSLRPLFESARNSAVSIDPSLAMPHMYGALADRTIDTTVLADGYETIAKHPTIGAYFIAGMTGNFPRTPYVGRTVKGCIKYVKDQVESRFGKLSGDLPLLRTDLFKEVSEILEKDEKALLALAERAFGQ